MREKFNSQEYRDNLVEEIKKASDEEERWEILEKARKTKEYKSARNFKIVERKKKMREVKESDAEKLFPILFESIQNEYPEYADRIKTVKFFRLDDVDKYYSGSSGEALYDVMNHRIVFSNALIEGFEDTDEDVRAVLMHKTAHEFMHAISYRNIERYENEGNDQSVFTGVSHSVVDNGVINKTMVKFNESLTNYFAYKIIPQAAENYAQQVAAERYRETRVDWMIINNILVGIVGEDVLRKAYFEGDLEVLRNTFAENRIDAETCFNLFEKNKAVEVAQMFAKARDAKR